MIAMKPFVSHLPRHSGSQHGMALIMGLMFLVALTLLGVGAMRGTMLEERMAGNARDRDMAFQSAEAAIRQAEQELAPGAALPVFALNTARTPRIAAGSLSTYWQNTHLWGTRSVPAAWQPLGTSEVPRYVIEQGEAAGGSLAFGAINNQIYRITARGVGRNRNTVVILQTAFQRP